MSVCAGDGGHASQGMIVTLHPSCAEEVQLAILIGGRQSYSSVLVSASFACHRLTQYFWMMDVWHRRA